MVTVILAYPSSLLRDFDLFLCVIITLCCEHRNHQQSPYPVMTACVPGVACRAAGLVPHAARSCPVRGVLLPTRSSPRFTHLRSHEGLFPRSFSARLDESCWVTTRRTMESEVCLWKGQEQGTGGTGDAQSYGMQSRSSSPARPFLPADGVWAPPQPPGRCCQPRGQLWPVRPLPRPRCPHPAGARLRMTWGGGPRSSAALSGVSFNLGC